MQKPPTLVMALQVERQEVLQSPGLAETVPLGCKW